MKQEQNRQPFENTNPYFMLTHGRVVRHSDIVELAPYTLPAIRTLIQDGKVLMRQEDIETFYYMPGSIKDQKCPMPQWERDFIETEISQLGRERE